MIGCSSLTLRAQTSRARRYEMQSAACLILLLIIATTGSAQRKANERPERPAVSVRGFELHGGFVNFVSGNGRCFCAQPANDLAKQPLANGDSIELEDGRAELVLIPGYYLRLSDHTTVRLLDLARDNLKMEITRGSAIIEIPVENEAPLPTSIHDIRAAFFNSVTVITPAAEAAIFKSGGYRFDVISNSESRIKVLKGAVAVAGHILEKGDAASVVAGVAGVESANQYPDDAFDAWSRERAAALIESNKSLKQSEWYKQMTEGHGYLEIREDAVAGDTESARIVSARNGVVEFVENGVTIKSSDGNWVELKAGAELYDGARLRTAAHTRAEIRPYPDFNLFMNGATEIVCRATAEGDISIELVKGSIVLMVAETKVRNEDRNTLKLSANGTEFGVTTPGYYRLNVFSANQSEMLYAGWASGGLGETGRGKRVVTQGQNRVNSSFDKDARDSFDIWSLRRNVRVELARLRRWMPTGLWFFNRETSEYTFLPGDREYKSPYGGSYSTTYRTSRVRRPDLSIRPNR